MTESLGIVSKLIDFYQEYRKSKQKKIEKIFNNEVDESFKKLEIIHNDYTKNLSQLRNHLLDKSLPPKDLIKWWRGVGLDFRSEREKLWTIEGEYLRLKNDVNNPLGNSEEQFKWHFKNYIVSIWDYHMTTLSHTEVSYYRDYEYELRTVLLQIENKDKMNISSEDITQMFYETDYVKDMHKKLNEITDKTLPKRWQDVCLHYRSLRRLAGYPNNDLE